MGYINRLEETVEEQYQKVMRFQWWEIRAGTLPSSKEKQKALILASPNCVFPLLSGRLYPWRLDRNDPRRNDYLATWPGRWIGCTEEAGKELDQMCAFYTSEGDFEMLTYTAACRRRFIQYAFPSLFLYGVFL